jgi:CrcB protein
MFDYLLVGLGGAIGSMARYGLGQMITARYGEGFPIATLVINVTGSFLIGLLATMGGTAGGAPNSSTMRLLLMVGVCGGYTTFSSFSLQSLNLIREGHLAAAGLNAILSVALCLIAVAAGHFAGLALNRARA